MSRYSKYIFGKYAFLEDSHLHLAVRIARVPTSFPVSIVSTSGESEDWPVTARVLDTNTNPDRHYSLSISTHIIDSGKQYCEVGAGLGAFIEAVIAQRPLQKPIIIDPCDYLHMRELLIHAQQIGFGSTFAPEIARLIERCSKYNDPMQVRHVQHKLGQAIQIYPELRACADVVVDNMGPRHYLLSEGTHLEDIQALAKKVKGLERMLLKDGGILLD